MNTRITNRPTSAHSLAEQKHARMSRASRAIVLLRFAADPSLELERALDAVESAGLMEPVLFPVAGDLVVLASGPRSRAELEHAVGRFERALAQVSPVPIGVGRAYDLDPGELDTDLTLSVLLDVALESSNRRSAAD